MDENKEIDINEVVVQNNESINQPPSEPYTTPQVSVQAQVPMQPKTEVPQVQEVIKNWELMKIQDSEQVKESSNADNVDIDDSENEKPKKIKKTTKKKKKASTKKKRKSKKDLEDEEDFGKKRSKKDNNADLDQLQKVLARRLKPHVEDDIYRRHYITEPLEYPPFETPEWRRPEMYDPWELRRRLYSARL